MRRSDRVQRSLRNGRHRKEVTKWWVEGKRREKEVLLKMAKELEGKETREVGRAGFQRLKSKAGPSVIGRRKIVTISGFRSGSYHRTM